MIDLSLIYADDGMVTAAEFEEVWLNIAVGYGLPAEDHTRYFEMVGNSSITLIRYGTAVPQSVNPHFGQNLAKGPLARPLSLEKKKSLCAHITFLHHPFIISHVTNRLDPSITCFPLNPH